MLPQLVPVTDTPTTELTLSACRALGGDAGPSAVQVARSSVDDGMADVKFAITSLST